MAVAAITLLLSVAGYFLASSPEQQVRGRVSELAAALRVDEELAPETLSRRLEPLLTTSIRLEAPELSVSGRANVIETISEMAARYRSADVAFRNPTVQLDTSSRATVRVEAALLERGDQHFDVKRDVYMDWVHSENGWRLAVARVGPEDEAEPEARP